MIEINWEKKKEQLSFKKIINLKGYFLSKKKRKENFIKYAPRLFKFQKKMFHLKIV